MAVKLQHEFVDVKISETLEHHVERRRLLRDEQDGLAVIQELRDRVGNRLRFASAGRTAHDEAAASPSGDNALAL